MPSEVVKPGFTVLPDTQSLCPCKIYAFHVSYGSSAIKLLSNESNSWNKLRVVNLQIFSIVGLSNPNITYSCQILSMNNFCPFTLLPRRYVFLFWNWIYNHIDFFFPERVSQCNRGLNWTHEPPASTSWVLEYLHTTTLGIPWKKIITNFQEFL